jgi:hypothetical protein
VLKTYTVASMRTLENKISDAGPADMRIDPHVLTGVRNRLLEQGVLNQVSRHNTPWYFLAGTAPELVEERLGVLVPLHREFQAAGHAIGQTLEIAAWRALIAQAEMLCMGNFLNLDDHDDATLYRKEEAPRTINGSTMPGDMKLDFVTFHKQAGAVGIEIKNLRQWMYPRRVEIRDMLLKCTTIDAVPVLIARRIHFSTFHVLTRCGVIVHQTYNHLLPATAAALAERARDKNLLGFHDIRLGNQPDARLTKFLHENTAGTTAGT